MSGYKVPMIGMAYYTDTQVPAVRKALFGIKALYGSQIAEASRLTGVAEELIASVVFIESSGKTDAVSSAGALGLMQLKPETAEDAVWLAARKDLLTDELKAALNRVLRGRLTALLKRANLSVLPALRIPRALLLRPDVSILLGSLLLLLLLKESAEKDEEARLDKVIARYNQGYFYRPKGSVKQVVATAPKEAAGYILKLVGINSTLDLLTA